MTTLKVIQNDKLYDLNFTLQNNSGGGLDLTGATILFKAQQTNNPNLKFSGSMVIVGSPASGQCKYTVQSGDFSVTGTYTAEIELTYPGGQIISFGDIQVIVSPELPKPN